MDDIFKQLDAVIEFDNRTIGMQMMQKMVLEWLVGNRQSMPQTLIDSLVARMEGVLRAQIAERPTVKEIA